MEKDCKHIKPPPMAVRLVADLHPSADGSIVRTSLVAGELQVARTDGRTHCGIASCPPTAGS